MLYHMLLATGLYFLCDWGHLASEAEQYTIPENAALQGIGLLTITLPLCLLLCRVRKLALKKFAGKK